MKRSMGFQLSTPYLMHHHLNVTFTLDMEKMKNTCDKRKRIQDPQIQRKMHKNPNIF
jgi:hypothetical protein